MNSNEADEANVSDSANQSQFIFVVCNPASQAHCKNEIAKAFPDLLPSFSRPGFLTWKLASPYPDRFTLPLTFTRSYGWSLEQVKSESSTDSIDDVLNRIAHFSEQQKAKHIHVWQREWIDKDQKEPTEGAKAVQQLIDKLTPEKTAPKAGRKKINQVANADDRIIDVVWIDANHWFIGWHIAGSIQQRWPGGIPVLPKPEKMISRAYMKTCEALMWSGINVTRGDTCAEIGSAPGGSCQRLLELGADVIAIDPADLDESIAKHKRLTHLKMRGKEVPHRSLAKVSWLLSDSNVTPTYILDTVQALSSSEQTKFRGVLLTLKLTDPKMVSELDSYVDRIKSFGFKFVKTRQLAFGRQEVFLLALKQKSVRRFRG